MNWWYFAIAALIYLTLLDTLRRTSELSRRLQRLEQKLDAVLNGLNIRNEGSNRPIDDWKSLAQDPSQKIQAIKAYRQDTGVGLAEAKRAVEAWIEQNGK